MRQAGPGAGVLRVFRTTGNVTMLQVAALETRWRPTHCSLRREVTHKTHLLLLRARAGLAARRSRRPRNARPGSWRSGSRHRARRVARRGARESRSDRQRHHRRTACERHDGGFPTRERHAARGQLGPWRMQRGSSAGWLHRLWLPRRGGGPGRLEATDSATIVVRRANGTTVAFPRERGTRLEVSGGPGACSGGHRGGCVALGFLGGAALGVLAPVVSSGTCRRLVCGLFVVTVPAGVVLGTIVGAVVGGEHWRTVEPPAWISVGPVGPGRFAVGLSVQF